MAIKTPTDMAPKPDSAARSRSGPEKYHVPSVARALQILEFLATHPRECGVTELADLLSLPKNSVFRILSTLADYGYLRRDPGQKVYGLTRKLLSLGYAATDEINLVEKSLDVMRSLRDATGETALVGTLVETQGVVLEQVPSPHPIKVMVEIGHHFPLHTSAPGKVLLAFLPADERDAVIERMEFTRFNDCTITDKTAYREELARVREIGYGLDRGEEVEDIQCIAAPLLNHRARPIAALWVTGPRARLQQQSFDHIGRLVIEQASVISERLGYMAQLNGRALPEKVQ